VWITVPRTAQAPGGNSWKINRVMRKGTLEIYSKKTIGSRNPEEGGIKENPQENNDIGVGSSLVKDVVPPEGKKAKGTRDITTSGQN